MTSAQASLMSQTAPAVSVLLPVYNGTDYIEAALRSVMEQSFTDMEIVVVDDCSTDDTPAILERLAAECPAIRIIRPPQNLGLPRALNFGLDHLRGTYVARMDADDICEPERIAVQKAFLDAHPEIVLIGCSTSHIDAQGHPFKTSIRRQDAYATRWMCRFVMPFRHPTFMFRRAEMPLQYDPEFSVSEDYEIMARLTKTHKTACLPDVLLRYRHHGGSITGKKRQLMSEQAERIALEVQRNDLRPEILDALEPFRAAYFRAEPLDAAGRRALLKGLQRMAAEDSAQSPAHSRWVYRQSAQLGIEALLRSGASRQDVIKSLITAGPSTMGSVILRFLETRQWIPQSMRSDQSISI